MNKFHYFGLALGLTTLSVAAEFSASSPAETVTVGGVEIRPAITPDGWLTSYDEALRRARAENKMVLMLFTGSDWCGPCMDMHARIFEQPAFKQWAARKFVLLYLDLPQLHELPTATRRQNELLIKKFGVAGVPQIFLLSPDGEPLTSVGYLPTDAATWTGLIEMLLPQEALAQPAPSYAGGWLTDYPQARQIAAALNRQVLLAFVSKGTYDDGKSQELREKILAEPKFAAYIAEKLVPVELVVADDAEIPEKTALQNATLLQAFGVETVPLVVVVNPDGAPTAAFVYDGTENNYLEMLQPKTSAGTN
ncbi:hypothetical protein AGMMS49959_10740 [Planctomycetales bacterium]|nr:hypothetical protein AGMMS49959_10740 [Planctomycetales bacterium]